VVGRIEQGRATREHLVAVATGLFTELGYEATSIQRVLEEADVSRGALYHHFASKEALFEAVLETVEAGIADALVAATAGAADAAGGLRAGARAWLDMAGDPAIAQIALTDAPSVVGWHRWREIDERHGLGLVKAGLGALAAEGRLRPELVDPYAHLLLAAMMEMALVVKTDPRPTTAANVAATVDDLLDRLLGA
jgi:AcrR family transcriptional regulator